MRLIVKIAAEALFWLGGIVLFLIALVLSVCDVEGIWSILPSAWGGWRVLAALAVLAVIWVAWNYLNRAYAGLWNRAGHWRERTFPTAWEAKRRKEATVPSIDDPVT